MTKRFNMVMSEQESAMLDELAERKGLTRSAMIRQLLRAAHAGGLTPCPRCGRPHLTVRVSCEACGYRGQARSVPSALADPLGGLLRSLLEMVDRERALVSSLRGQAIDSVAEVARQRVQLANARDVDAQLRGLLRRWSTGEVGADLLHATRAMVEGKP